MSSSPCVHSSHFFVFHMRELSFSLLFSSSFQCLPVLYFVYFLNTWKISVNEGEQCLDDISELNMQVYDFNEAHLDNLIVRVRHLWIFFVCLFVCLFCSFLNCFTEFSFDRLISRNKAAYTWIFSTNFPMEIKLILIGQVFLCN